MKSPIRIFVFFLSLGLAGLVVVWFFQRPTKGTDARATHPQIIKSPGIVEPVISPGTIGNKGKENMMAHLQTQIARSDAYRDLFLNRRSAIGGDLNPGKSAEAPPDSTGIGNDRPEAPDDHERVLSIVSGGGGEVKRPDLPLLEELIESFDKIEGGKRRRQSEPDLFLKLLLAYEELIRTTGAASNFENKHLDAMIDRAIVDKVKAGRLDRNREIFGN